MPFRSEKSLSRACSKPALAFALALGLGWIPEAGAITTQLNAVRRDGQLLENLVDGARAYFPAASGATGNFFLDSADPSVAEAPLDLSQRQNTDAPNGYSNIMRFEITSDKVVTPAAGEVAVLFVTAAGDVPTSSGVSSGRLVPIATIGSVDQLCTSSSNCRSQVNVSDSTYRFAVDYTPNTTIRIGIYPQDVCRAYHATATGATVAGETHPIGTSGSSAYGCSTTTALPDRATSATAMQLSFWIGTMSSSESAVPALPTGTADRNLTVYFPTQPTAMTCPANMTDIYFPGDASIELNAQGFYNSNAFPPPSMLIVIGKLESEPAFASTYANDNQIAQRVEFGARERVGGFTNKTSEADSTEHHLGFMVRDVAGWVSYTAGASAYASGTGCRLNGVQTSPILGALREGQCFIATGAFGSPNAKPVLMLREFRDRVLLKTAPGKAFVRWYYGWSPGAAEWLMENPAFRAPVLVALVPVQIVAWLCLNPLWLLGLAFVIGNLILVRSLREAR